MRAESRTESRMYKSRFESRDEVPLPFPKQVRDRSFFKALQLTCATQLKFNLDKKFGQ